MYKEVLRSISDVSIFPVIAFVMFFVFFVLLLVYVLKMDKKEIRHMSSIPLDDNLSFIRHISPNGKAHDL